ncbi:MAG: hypothetical protein WB689_13335 [Xanthobacteraceae bacterium]
MRVQGHRRIEAPRTRFSRSTFRLKLGRKAARGLGLGGSAAAIYSHSQERRDLLVLGHAADFRWARGAFNSVERLRVNKDFKELEQRLRRRQSW